MREPAWLDLRDALALHERMLVRFGGASGLRDRGLLESALARPRQRFHVDESCDLCDLAATCGSGLVRNHPFLDGNKRTGFLAAVLFLEINGGRFLASEEAATHAVLGLASGELADEGFAAFLRDNTVFPHEES